MLSVHRLFNRAASAALFLLVAGQGFSATQWPGPYFVVDGFAYSETVPLESALHDWEGDAFRPGERQWAWSWLEAGVQWGNFSLGYVLREHYDLRFTPDTADLYWRNANQTDLPVDRVYDLNLYADHFKAQGMRVAFLDGVEFNHFGSLQYRVGVSYWQADDLINGTLVGQAQAIADNDYVYQADLAYHYSEDRLFERQVAEPDGSGYSIDLALAWQSEQHKVTLDIKDLWGEIVWEQAPYTVGTLNSNNRTYDANGYVRINPTLSGYEGISDQYKQALVMRWDASYRYELEAYGVGVLLQRQFDQTFYGGAVYFGRGHGFSVSYWPEPEMIGFAWRRSGWQVGVAADSLTDDARALRLQFSFQPEVMGDERIP